MKKNQKRKTKKPWPTKKVMEQIYDQNLWGENQSKFYSGFGSHNLEFVEPYIEVVKDFLNSLEKPITVCDLGCGDFNIGNKLFKFSKNYIAVDIVEDLITFNNKNFKADNLSFQSLNISKDNLPKADCVIIRQVFQHLSNAEIQSVLEKLSSFKYVILTEHIPKGDFIPNIDIISGQGIRLKKQSGLDILKPPFSFKIKKEKHLISIDIEKQKGLVATWLYEVY